LPINLTARQIVACCICQNQFLSAGKIRVKAGEARGCHVAPGALFFEIGILETGILLIKGLPKTRIALIVIQ
jgi:hypothetical protein